MKKEIWKDIELGSCVYSISSYGNVFNKTRNCNQTLSLSGRGYLTLYTQKHNRRKTYTVHRLVATLFIPNPLNKKTINHKNGNKLDNRIENLEWCSYQENNIHAIANGLRNYTKRMKPIVQSRNGVVVKKYNSIREAIKETKIDGKSIVNCCKHKPHYKSAGGYQWEYYK